ncbi:MAG: acetoacetyl-CoA reductase [Gammaproteobacteria bacterium]
MDNQIALVTGGTGGIGTAICRALRDSGFTVAAGYNNAGDPNRAVEWQKAQRDQDYEFTIHYGDVSNSESSVALVAEVEEMVGPISVLVNNAGITRDSTLKKMSSEQWQAVLRTNLDSLFNMTHAILNGMIARNWGRIISISSINGQKGQFGQCNYSAAKAGVHGFTKALALEVANKGITVNTISPGYVATEMVKQMRQDVLDQIVAQIPMGRLAQPEEIANLVAYLASDKASFITGANFAINGGQHMF